MAVPKPTNETREAQDRHALLAEAWKRFAERMEKIRTTTHAIANVTSPTQKN